MLSPTQRVEEPSRAAAVRRYRRRELRAAALLLGPLVLLYGCWLEGLRINLTGSLPIGLYAVTHGAPAHGALVLVCLPARTAEWARDRGYVPRGASCPGRAMPVGKPVFALPGDVVTVTDSGLLLNGRLTPNSRPLLSDRRGRPLPRLAAGRYAVGPGELWVVSPYSALSFDSRYFGAVPIANVQARVRLLWSVTPMRITGRGDAALGQPAQVEPPRHLAPQLPHVEHQIHVVLGSRGSPAIDPH